MKTTSIFNDVIGPVMRGPSSSHTAGTFHLAKLARSFFGSTPKSVQCTFDPNGSIGRLYREQGADKAFACGILDIPLTDKRFHTALTEASSQGINLHFAQESIPNTDHPNTIHVILEGKHTLAATGKSIGGGACEITAIDDLPVSFTGNFYELAVEIEEAAEAAVRGILQEDGETKEISFSVSGDTGFLCAHRYRPLASIQRTKLQSQEGAKRILAAGPVFFVKRGEPIFTSAAGMLNEAEKRGFSLGRTAICYEAELLGLSETEVKQEMGRRLDVMLASVKKGLRRNEKELPMQLLRPSAGKIFSAEAAGKLAVGGMHTRAAARAMATMHVNSSMGVVCAAPTGGSAGVIPAVITTLIEEMSISRQKAIECLFAAGACGLIVAQRATFAAETAGCQVEIGAAGAMASAAVVEAAGGKPAHAASAASIAFQNTMGSVCDLIQGIVEIPCHTRNAQAASSAFLCADLIMGGYEDPIPLDETIDAVYAVGKMLPSELRCTALGGLAATPAGRGLETIRFSRGV